MKELIDKLSSYNLFNYLLPGVLYSVLLKETYSVNIINDDLFIGLFIFYLVGLSISRLGSLILQPIIEKMKITKPGDYTGFVKSELKDSKLSILSETNNMYRTLTTSFLLLLLTKPYFWLVKKTGLSEQNQMFILIIALLILFTFSYRKQTEYIGKRIDSNEK